MKQYGPTTLRAPHRRVSSGFPESEAYRGAPIASPLQSSAASHRENPEVQGRLAALQLRKRASTELGSQTTEEVHALAQDGIAGAGSALPHRAAIQASFGHHDISGIRSHTDDRASQAAEALGARGYAAGADVAFSGAPSLHTAAHEAAHVIQQRAGVHLKGGVGVEGDVYERHADAVAERVVAGRSAVDLLDGVAGGGRRSALQLSPSEEEDEAPSTASASAEERSEGHPLQAEEVREAVRGRLVIQARNFGEQGTGWSDVTRTLTEQLSPDQQQRDCAPFFKELAYPTWLEGLRRGWIPRRLVPEVESLVDAGLGWPSLWARVKDTLPDVAARGELDWEREVQRIWENLVADQAPEAAGSAGAMDAEDSESQGKG